MFNPALIGVAVTQLGNLARFASQSATGTALAGLTGTDGTTGQNLPTGNTNQAVSDPSQVASSGTAGSSTSPSDFLTFIQQLKTRNTSTLLQAQEDGSANTQTARGHHHHRHHGGGTEGTNSSSPTTGPSVTDPNSTATLASVLAQLTASQQSGSTTDPTTVNPTSATINALYTKAINAYSPVPTQS